MGMADLQRSFSNRNQGPVPLAPPRVWDNSQVYDGRNLT